MGSLGGATSARHILNISFAIQNLCFVSEFLIAPTNLLSIFCRNESTRMCLPVLEYHEYCHGSIECKAFHCSLFTLFKQNADFSVLQCSRTRCVKFTDFRLWTANGCWCESRWRSALYLLTSPSNSLHFTYRRTCGGKISLELDGGFPWVI